MIPQGAILQSMLTNWLNHIFALTAYVWEAAPCSTLPTAETLNAACQAQQFWLGAKARGVRMHHRTKCPYYVISTTSRQLQFQ